MGVRHTQYCAGPGDRCPRSWPRCGAVLLNVAAKFGCCPTDEYPKRLDCPKLYPGLLGFTDDTSYEPKPPGTLYLCGPCVAPCIRPHKR